MKLVCECCGKEFDYKGYGRPPLYCLRCRSYVRRKQRKEHLDEWRKNNKSQSRKLTRKHTKQYYWRKLSNKKRTGNPFRNYRDYREYREWWNKNTWKSLTLNGVRVWIRGDKYNQWWRASKRKTREYMKRWREENSEYMKEYLREYHKQHRDRYHRDTDMGYSLARDKFGNPDFETERSVIDAEYARLGLKKKRDDEE